MLAEPPGLGERNARGLEMPIAVRVDAGAHQVLDLLRLVRRALLALLRRCGSSGSCDDQRADERGEVDESHEAIER